MATTTPNFGWPVPTSSDLVKNGATAIEGLGDAIDASLLDLKGGTTGQVLAKASGTDMDFTWSAIDPLVILDAKGDLITATAADTPARLAVGTNNQILTADSTTATGLKWATPSASSSGMTLIQNTTLTSTAADFTFSSIPSTYTHLKIVFNGRTNESGANVSNLRLQLNADTGSNYRTGYGGGFSTMSVTAGGSATSFDLRYINGPVQTTFGMGISEIILPDYKGTVLRKGIQWITTCEADSPAIFTGTGTWQNTSAITSVKIFFGAAGSFIVGSSVSLYGWS